MPAKKGTKNRGKSKKNVKRKKPARTPAQSPRKLSGPAPGKSFSHHGIHMVSWYITDGVLYLVPAYPDEAGAGKRFADTNAGDIQEVVVPKYNRKKQDQNWVIEIKYANAQAFGPGKHGVGKAIVIQVCTI
jgi:hypothetical protein